MNALQLESPVAVEALAFDYLSYGFLMVVHNVWAWIALITAAVSFWRIRALSSPVVERRSCSEAAPLAPSISVAKASAAAGSAPGETKEALSASRTTLFCELDGECSAKAKFTVYYEEDELREGGGGDEGCDGGESAAPVKDELGIWLDDFEVLRLGDLGWYRWQDLTVLDGSVVRMWDASRQRRRIPAAWGRRM